MKAIPPIKKITNTIIPSAIKKGLSITDIWMVGNPIMKKGNGIFGPGHCSVTKSRDGQLWMVYHQQKNGSPGWNRIICIDSLWFDEQGNLHGKATRGLARPVPGQG